jgi:hypothetical protein
LHRLFARIRGFGTAIIPHVATRLKPVNELSVSCITTPSRSRCFLPNAAEGTGVAATKCRKSPANAASVQHSRAIEYESRLRMRSSLVIRFAQDQDEFTSSIRQTTG